MEHGPASRQIRDGSVTVPPVRTPATQPNLCRVAGRRFCVLLKKSSQDAGYRSAKRG